MLGTVAVVFFSVELGFRLARYRKQRFGEETEAPIGGMVGATLGLLAFMLAFTFGLAASRFDDRRQVVLDEANAIGTTYLRAAMLSEPIRTESRGLLREYVDVRLEAAQGGNVGQAISNSEQMHERLWSQAVAAAEKDRSPITGLFIQSLNEVIDLHAKRVMVGLRSRVPGAIWIALYLLALLSMAAMGYQEGLSSTKRSIAALALVLAFSLVLILIVDLDRPGEGLLRVSQQSMIDLRNSMAVPGSGPQN
ncbi:MAG TPA: hypothetical protein VLG74_17110 [Blastocatellia bacterium]|nr:hypothetical protein [Blastocatellia bacterium]